MTIKSKLASQATPSLYNDSGEAFLPPPVPVIRLSWHNGTPQSPKNSAAQHYGGWQRGKDDFDADVDALGLQLPEDCGINLATWTSKEGTEYEAYSTRNIYAAPIKVRDDWWEEFDATKGRVVKRHRLDVLVMLAGYDAQAKKLYKLAPAILTAHNYAASAVLKAIKAFEKDTKEAREEHAPGVPLQFFYIPLGTFGDKRITTPAGESSIVPCQYMQRATWDEKFLTFLFVGDETGAEILQIAGDATDWVNDTHDNRAKDTAEMDQDATAPPIDGFDPANAAFAESDLYPDGQ